MKPQRISQEPPTIAGLQSELRKTRKPLCECGREKRVLVDDEHLGVMYASNCDICEGIERADRRAEISYLRRENLKKNTGKKRHEVRQELIARGFPAKALDQRFGSFIRNDENLAAYSMAFNLPKAAYKGLFLTTDKSPEAQSRHPLNSLGTGIGKTHLINACAIKFYALGFDVKYAVVADLLREIRERYSRNKGSKYDKRADDIVNRFLTAQVIVLDDIGVEKPSEFVEETLFVIVNHIDTHKKILLATSNLSMAELEQRIGKRITSRIGEMCHVAEYLDEDWRLKRI
jgi:DNA replication protein DnaC